MKNVFLGLIIGMGIAGALTVLGDSATVTAIMCSAGMAVNGMSNGVLQCSTMASIVLRGTSNPLGGGLLLAGSCATATGTLTGVTASTSLNASPATSTDIGLGLSPADVYMSSANTVTVRRCAILAVTPVATPYNISGNQ